MLRNIQKGIRAFWKVLSAVAASLLTARSRHLSITQSGERFALKFDGPQVRLPHNYRRTHSFSPERCRLDKSTVVRSRFGWKAINLCRFKPHLRLGHGSCRPASVTFGTVRLSVWLPETQVVEQAYRFFEWMQLVVSGSCVSELFSGEEAKDVGNRGPPADNIFILSYLAVIGLILYTSIYMHRCILVWCHRRL